MNILLTGGAGYVGSACLRWLLRHGHNPFAYDNLSTGNDWSVPRERLIRGDILDIAPLCHCLTSLNIEGVIHLAALSVVNESLGRPGEYWRINVAGTKNVLDAMSQCGVERLLFSSSCAVYGDSHQGPITEFTPCQPAHPYGATKLAAENMIRDYTRKYRLGSTILRYFNVAGADMDGQFGEAHVNETRLIPLILSVAAGARDKVHIYGDDWPTRDGTCIRDFVHCEDLACAHQLAIETTRPGECRTYNVATGTGVTVKEVLAACENVVGRPIPRTTTGRRRGDPHTLYALADRITAELRWRPRLARIDDIVRTAWNWHKRSANTRSRMAA